MNTLFYDLKPDIILAAVESAGFDPTGHCMALNSYENRVFDIRLADDSHIIVKFYRPGRWSREQIEEEHSFLFELQENDIPVCTPLHLAGGGSLRETEGILYAVWPRTGGRQRDEFTDVQLLMLGRLIARIHNTGAAKETVHRRTLDGDTYGRNVLSFLREHDFLPQSCEARYSDAVNRVADIYDNISKSVPYHRIHGDCHQGNLLSGTDGWFFLDFDDFVRGPAVQDLWMLLPVTSREGLRQRELLLDGYRTFRDFDQSWLRLIEPLRALRYIHYAGWIARRWEDPAFPRIFPHFGTDEYWENETSDLEKQLELIIHFEERSAHLYTHDTVILEDEAELSNRELFWDWEE